MKYSHGIPSKLHYYFTLSQSMINCYNCRIMTICQNNKKKFVENLGKLFKIGQDTLKGVKICQNWSKLSII